MPLNPLESPWPAGPVHLIDHLLARFLADSSPRPAPSLAVLEEFAAFVRAELDRHPPVAFGPGAAGLNLTLMDDPPIVAALTTGAAAPGGREPAAIPVSSPYQPAGPLAARGTYPITGPGHSG